jgi:hypothetical protein
MNPASFQDVSIYHPHPARCAGLISGVAPRQKIRVSSVAEKPSSPLSPNKLVSTLALTCFLSPRERTYHRCVPVYPKTIQPIPSHDIPKTRRIFLPLRRETGERAGAREIFRALRLICVSSVVIREIRVFTKLQCRAWKIFH